MFYRASWVFIVLVFSAFCAQAQKAFITGRVTDDKGEGIDLVTIAVQGTSVGTRTDPQGVYNLEVPLGRQVVVYSFVGYESARKVVTFKDGETKVFNVTMSQDASTMLGEVVKTAETDPGSLTMDVTKARFIAGPVGGVEAIIKSYVGSNNELTSQYNVRGGNFDENLVYINDFEVYRPFLTRSGQQEGLSVINSDLVNTVNFSIGGFQAKYGDKMSSVLDIGYKRPKKFAGSVMASLLGASMHLEGATKNEKLTYLIGLRQKTNQYLLQSQPTKGVYNPSFTDLQGLVNYRFSDKWQVEVIGNYARNRFNFIPEESTSSFGLVNKAFQLRVSYLGNEIDQFDSRFGGISTTYRPNSRLQLKLLASGFQTNERETYDISGEYFLGELETDLGKQNFGNVKIALGTGVIHNYARNYLKVNVGDLGHRGSYDGGKHFIQWGLNGTVNKISDQLHEWERRDSAGFTQPYDPNKLELTKLYRSATDLNFIRYSGFIQDNFHFNDSLRLTMSVGARFNYNTLNQEFLISPRAQLSYRPEWKNDFVFKLAGGLYQQPPFYREMRDLDGNVNTALKAQKSAHIVAGFDYNFIASKRPFKVTTEFYYKSLWDVVPYEYDNVRIRYFGQNNAVGYVYGGEVRIFGDLVKDATSWISLGIMKAAEDVTNDRVITRYESFTGAITTDTTNPGYIPRPTDQRVMVGMYFEDYLPRNKNFKVHINGMYSTGLPFGPPDKQRYGDTLRLPDYKRVDIGFSALLLDGKKPHRPAHSFFRQLTNVWLSLEVFNLLGIQNTLSYTWIQDQTSGGTFAVPNRLTSRLLNVKLAVDF